MHFIKNKYNLFYCVFFTIISLQIHAQDAEFSQFFSSKLYLNPAFAGNFGSSGVGVHFRDQRFSLGSISNTINISFSQYIEKLRGGVGIQILNDNQASSINRTQIDGIYSYPIQINNFLYVSGGVQFSVFRKSINLSDFSLPKNIDPIDQIEYADPYSYKSPFHFDYSAGVIGNYKSSYFGIAVHHLTEPVEHDKSMASNEFKTKRKYTFHYGTMIKIFKNGLIREKYSISPNIIYQIQNTHRINYGLYVLIQNITLGSWVRQALPTNFDSAIFLVGYEFPKYALSYSYDYKLPKTGTFININTHEVTLNIFFQYNQKKKIKAIKCPKF